MKLQLPGVNPSVLAIVAEGFLSRLSFGLISFALPLFALRLGMGLPEIGMLISLDAFVALALKSVTGWVADRIGLKRAFTFATILRGLVSFFLIFAGSPWQLFAIRALHGVSASLRDPSVNALIAEHGGKKNIASVFAWYSTAKSVAGSFAKAAAGILLTLTVSNFSLVFVLASFLSLLPLYAVIRYVRVEMVGVSPLKHAAENRSLRSAFRPAVLNLMGSRPVPRNGSSQLDEVALTHRTPLWKDILPFIALGMMLSGTANMLSGLFPVLATEYAGLTEAQTGLIYMLSTAVILISGPIFGWLADHISHKLVLLVRSGANIFSSIVYIFFPHLFGVAFGKILDDTGKAAFRPAWGALMAYVSSFDRRRRAQTISYLNMAEDLGAIAAPIVAGLLWSAFGLPFVLGARILFAVITEAYAVWMDHPAENTRALAKDHSYP